MIKNFNNVTVIVKMSDKWGKNNEPFVLPELWMWKTLPIKIH